MASRKKMFTNGMWITRVLIWTISTIIYLENRDGFRWEAIAEIRHPDYPKGPS